MSIKLIYQEDKFQLDADRVSKGNDPDWGPTTIFHDVVIASERVQPYGDGKALKHRDELEAYTKTVNGRWIIAGGHPESAIISERDQIAGRTFNAHYVKNLNDPKTGRPNRAGTRADVEVFDKHISPKILEDMKKGKKADVSIGFFFNKDEKAGMVEDGPFKGDSYDYVQRDMFHDHLAVGIDNGRCPSPYCGLTADEIKSKVATDPFSGFGKFSDCTSKIMGENPKMPAAMVEGICGKLKAEHEKSKKKEDAMKKVAQILELMEELEATRGEHDATTEGKKEWWKALDWTRVENKTTFDSLSDETRKMIQDAGLCPSCLDEAARKVSKDATLEEIDVRITELKARQADLTKKIRMLTDKLFEDSPEEKGRKEDIKRQLDPLWSENDDIYTELNIYTQAKVLALSHALEPDAEAEVQSAQKVDGAVLPPKDSAPPTEQKDKLPEKSTPKKEEIPSNKAEAPPKKEGVAPKKDEKPPEIKEVRLDPYEVLKRAGSILKN